MRSLFNILVVTRDRQKPGSRAYQISALPPRYMFSLHMGPRMASNVRSSQFFFHDVEILQDNHSAQLRSMNCIQIKPMQESGSDDISTGRYNFWSHIIHVLKQKRYSGGGILCHRTLTKLEWLCQETDTSSPICTMPRSYVLNRVYCTVIRQWPQGWIICDVKILLLLT